VYMLRKFIGVGATAKVVCSGCFIDIKLQINIQAPSGDGLVVWRVYK
jgi:predicted  nucleic acid-binding Zn-ribbon protein